MQQYLRREKNPKSVMQQCLEAIKLRSRLYYRHPVNHNYFYFVGFRSKDGVPHPVGCRPIRKHEAAVFESKAEAKRIFDYLTYLGYEVKYSI